MSREVEADAAGSREVLVGDVAWLESEGLLAGSVSFELDVMLAGCEEVLLLLFERFVRFDICEVELLIVELDEVEAFPLLSEVPFVWTELVELL